MSELEFLRKEAELASAPSVGGFKVEVRMSEREEGYDVLFGGETVGRLLGSAEALACIKGVGGSLAVISRACGFTAGTGTKRGVVEVVDSLRPRWKKTFRSKRAARQWLMEGLAACDGAEQEHYANMLVELECGETVLHYN